MKGASRADDARRRGRRWMALLFALLPGVLVLGLMAPEFVKVAPAEEHVVAQSDAEPLFQPPPLRKPPLLVPRDFTSSAALVDLQNLFSQSFAPTDRQLRRMVAFPKNSGELIALDDVHEELREVTFKDVLAAALLPRTPLPGPPGFLPLDGTIPRSNGLRYDDFPLPGNGAEEFTSPIPEPGTALMVGLGLLMMGWIRQRQPTTR